MDRPRPVDRGTGGRRRARVAAVVLLAPSTGCNLFGGGDRPRSSHLLRSTTFADASLRLRIRQQVLPVVCGESSPEMQARIRSDVVEAATALLAERSLRAAREPDPH
jgi:hypothetical protein